MPNRSQKSSHESRFGNIVRTAVAGVRTNGTFDCSPELQLSTKEFSGATLARLREEYLEVFLYRYKPEAYTEVLRILARQASDEDIRLDWPAATKVARQITDGLP